MSASGRAASPYCRDALAGRDRAVGAEACWNLDLCLERQQELPPEAIEAVVQLLKTHADVPAQRSVFDYFVHVLIASD